MTGIELIRLYTSKTAQGTQDNSPNELGGNAQPEFYVTVVAEADDLHGDLEAAYTLFLRATSTSGGTTTFTRKMNKERVEGIFDWKNLGGNNGYTKTTHLVVPAADFTPGDSYQFVATLTTKTGLISKAGSNEFIIIG